MALKIDVNTSVAQTSTSSITTSTFSTISTNEALFAFIMADAGVDMDTVTGGGLAWQLICRPTSGAGMAYIWGAVARAILTNVTVTGSIINGPAASAFLNVVSFTGADTTGGIASAYGAFATSTQVSGTPSATLVTTRNNSWVFGCVSDVFNNDTPAYGTNQSQVALNLDVPNSVSQWVQSTTIPTPTLGTSVTINDTSPVGISYGMAITEVLPFFDKTVRVEGNAQQPFIRQDILSY